MTKDKSLKMLDVESNFRFNVLRSKFKVQRSKFKVHNETA